ncbi:hypothetical protein D8859_04025 [Streptococcus oralis]|nr:hypothetical protein D8859_04025 [Streptococcus oralis]
MNTTKDKISDLVSYDGSSHTSTVMDYNFLLNQIKNLDSSITQYESNHASQDLVAFKELLAATKALIAEHAGKTRTVGTYQSGDFAKLKSVQRFAIAYKQATQQMESRVERVKAAQERDKVRFEALARSDKGWKDMAVSALTIIVGVTAIVVTWGSATPLVVAGGIVGLGTTAYGLSNMYEAGQDIKLGNAGDIQTKAGNPIRDTLFMGNDKLYHDVGNVFTTASAIMIPIGQTQSVVKGLTQFAIGEASAYTAGQVAYHGTKLLGGSEEDAQTANFIGNIVGGYTASSAASKFSLNKVKVDVEAPKYNREQILKNIEESRLARESSGFKEFALNEKYKLIMNDNSSVNLHRKLKLKEYVEWGISPADSVRVLEISENAPKIKYIKDTFTKKQIIDIKPNPDKGIFRPDVEDYLDEKYIKAHIRQFKNGVAKFQKFKPDENWRNGVVGDNNGNSFWLSKKHADIIEKVANGDNRLFEKLLGFDEGYFGDGPIYRLDVSPEVVARKGAFIPTGNEDGANDWWRPGGRTYPGGIPEAVMKDISTKRGDHTWNVVN